MGSLCTTFGRRVMFVHMCPVQCLKNMEKCKGLEHQLVECQRELGATREAASLKEASITLLKLVELAAFSSVLYGGGYFMYDIDVI